MGFTDWVAGFGRQRRRKRLEGMLDTLNAVGARNSLAKVDLVRSVRSAAAIPLGHSKIAVFPCGPSASASHLHPLFVPGVSAYLADHDVALALCAETNHVFADLAAIGRVLSRPSPESRLGCWHVMNARDGDGYLVVREEGRLEWRADTSGAPPQPCATWDEALDRLDTWEGLLVAAYSAGLTLGEVRSPLLLGEETKFSVATFKAQ